MKMDKQTPVGIGLTMPRWVPKVMHAPAKLLLGLCIGMAMGLYALALAVAVLRVFSVPSGIDPLALGNLLALLVGAWVVRLALKRWARGHSIEL
ncbi:MAG: hypothetical protein AAGB10_08090 [Pseudomonadota bacterium]